MPERTLVMIKPDAVQKKIVGELIRRYEEAGYAIKALQMIHLSQEQAETFYAVHQGKAFYEPLIQFMIEAPCIPMVLEGEGVIQGVRELNGATDPKNAEAGTIRKDFAENGRRNAVHASDSAETAEKEIGFFFPRYELI